MRYQTMRFCRGKERITLIHMNKPLSNGLAGMITSPLFKENVAVIVDDTPEDEREYDFACLACGENGTVPRVMMTREVYYDIKRNEPYARTALFHELGHYCNGDLSSPKKDRNKERTNLVASGTVSEEELNADFFAASYFGKEFVVSGLEKIMKLTEEMYKNQYDADDLAIVLRELSIRISTILEKNRYFTKSDLKTLREVFGYPKGDYSIDNLGDVENIIIKYTSQDLTPRAMKGNNREETGHGK